MARAQRLGMGSVCLPVVGTGLESTNMRIDLDVVLLSLRMNPPLPPARGSRLRHVDISTMMSRTDQARLLLKVRCVFYGQ